MIAVQTENVVKENLSIAINPNPSSGVFTIQSKDPSVQWTTMFITNAGGEEVFRNVEKIGAGYKVDLQNAAKGLYLLHLENSNGITIKKLVLQ